MRRYKKQEDEGMIKRIALVLVFILTCALGAQAGLIYVTDAKYEARLKVFFTDAKYEADLIVYVEKNAKYEARGKDEIWFYVEQGYEADVPVYVTKDRYEADLKVYVTDAKYEAGWKTSHPWRGRLAK